MKTQAVIDQKVFLQKIKEEVLRVDPEATVILFGSRARGDFKEDSDWDILVLSALKPIIVFEDKVVRNLYTIELEYNQTIAAIVIEKAKWEKAHKPTDFYNIIKSEGVAL